MNLEEQIRDQLRTVIDPELSINIVDLGLIYEIKIDQSKNEIEVLMTLTTPGCPMAEFLPKMAEEKIQAEFPDKEIKVTTVWTPAWTPELITENGRSLLGMN